MKIPFIDLSAIHEPSIPDYLEGLKKIFQTNSYVLGPVVSEFESAFASYIGSRHAVGVASGTDALLLSLDALGIGPGDEVITSVFSFIATADVIIRLKAKPVFVDVDEATFNLNVEQVAAAVTPSTKAILAVHLFGNACNMAALREIARDKRLYIIEDCAQSTGAKYGEVRTGTIGSTGCFSFFPTKNLPGVGDGGMIVTNQDDLTEKLRKFRDHGRITGYIHDIIGYNSRLDSMQAVVLKTLLEELEEFNADRIANAKLYSDLFKGTEAIAPEVPEDGSHVFNIYTIRVRQRNRLQDFLQERGIGSRVYYPLPLHLQPCLRYLGYVEGTFPAAEQLAKEVLSLPVYPGISKRAIEKVAETILEYLRTHN